MFAFDVKYGASALTASSNESLSGVNVLKITLTTCPARLDEEVAGQEVRVIFKTLTPDSDLLEDAVRATCNDEHTSTLTDMLLCISQRECVY
jgi:hypothetical protein